MKKLPDWLVRAIKTFVEAFLGVFLTALVPILNNGWPEDWHTVWLLVPPALAAAITAAWNVVLERHKNSEAK